MSSQRVGWPRRRGVGDDVDSPESPPACRAPSRALFVFPDGAVRPCCVNTRPLGNLRTSTLREIWFGERRAELVAAVAAHDYTVGCDGCGAEVALEGPAEAYPRQFDHFGPASGQGETWPATLGLYLANTCNLQCQHCDGGLSSSIRKHREGLPPIRSRYDESFFDDLRMFLPHLEHVLFAGGEPFLIPEVFRCMSLIAREAPELPCTVITNGTQWNPRVRAALESTRCSVMVSIDGATRETFEAMRSGADFDVVWENLERFREYAAAAGTSVGIIFSLMASNVHELADLLLKADALGIPVDVSVVRSPERLSLARRTREELGEAYARLLDRHDEMVGSLQLNLGTWRAELERVRTWSLSAPDDLDELGGPSHFTVLMFRREGSGPTDPERARAELLARAPDGAVYDVTIGVGDVVVDTSPALDELVGLPPGSLDGRPATDLWAAVSQRFGRSSGMEETYKDDDLARMVVEFDGWVLDVVAVPDRDHAGRADTASLSFIVRPTATT